MGKIHSQDDVKTLPTRSVVSHLKVLNNGAGLT